MSSIFSALVLIFSALFSPIVPVDSVPVDSAPIVSSSNVDIIDPYALIDNYDDYLDYETFSEGMDMCYNLNGLDEIAGDECAFDLANTYEHFGIVYYKDLTMRMGEVSPSANRFFNYYETGVDYGLNAFPSI